MIKRTVFFFIFSYCALAFGNMPFNEFVSRVHELPTYGQVGQCYTHKGVSAAEFRDVLDLFYKDMPHFPLAHVENWLYPSGVETRRQRDYFLKFFTEKSTSNKRFFVQKKLVDPGSIVVFHGDLHADVHALVSMLLHLQQEGYMDVCDGFRIAERFRDSLYFVFLGDYVDRGNYGAEVLYTLLRLKIAQPDRVILLRGNHESQDLNMMYGFSDELHTKFCPALVKRIYRLYDFFPSALYLGAEVEKNLDVIQCCHGGIEIGYDPRPLLASEAQFQWLCHLDRSALNLSFCKNRLELFPCGAKKFIPESPFDLGFLWNDFFVNPKKTIVYQKGRGLIYGAGETAEVLRAWSTPNAKVHAIFRGHQHACSRSLTPMMDLLLNPPSDHQSDIGVAKLWQNKYKKCNAEALWDGMVCTFLVAPGTPYGTILGFDFDAFAILHIGNEFKEWRLKIHRLSQLSLRKRRHNWLAHGICPG